MLLPLKVVVPLVVHVLHPNMHQMKIQWLCGALKWSIRTPNPIIKVCWMNILHVSIGRRRGAKIRSKQVTRNQLNSMQITILGLPS